MCADVANGQGESTIPRAEVQRGMKETGGDQGETRKGNRRPKNSHLPLKQGTSCKDTFAQDIIQSLS